MSFRSSWSWIVKSALDDVLVEDEDDGARRPLRVIDFR